MQPTVESVTHFSLEISPSTPETYDCTEYVLSQLTVSFPIKSSANHLPWLLSAVEAVFLMRRW